jgi:serine/threonine protein kinase
MDIFALGVTTYVALTGKNNRPDLQTFTSAVDEYINGNVGNAVRLLNQAKILLSSDWVNLNVEREVSQLITRMLDINPQNRPSVDEIITILSKYV